MDMAPFSLATFSAFEAHHPRHPYAGNDDGLGAPFRISDPFGLRRAVLPVFQRDPDGETRGIGTAFHVDGWGRLLTADHVVDYARARHLREIQPNALIELNIGESQHATVLLGYGLTFGTINIPDQAWAPIFRMDVIVQQHDDPMAQLKGESSYRAAADLAGMTSLPHPHAPPMHTLPVDFQWQPEIGEPVLAVGYPELGLQALREGELAHYLHEGMFGAYGRITGIFPGGRDRTRPTPVFEVEADWQSGMSGGPVFNRKGHVVGVVSCSLSPSGDLPGKGYATCLSWIPEASSLVPTLDAFNAGYRLGFGVLRPDPWHLAAVTERLEEAERERLRLASDYIVVWGSHQIGSDNFVAH